MAIGVLTSGGDAPGMNAAIRALVRSAVYENKEVLGIRNGYTGIFNEDAMNMDLSSVADIIHKGGTILGTSRSEKMRTEEGLIEAKKHLDAMNIEHLVVIGGAGSMQGALALSKLGQSVITIPATIDNDLGYQHGSIGFYTAIETILDAIGKIRDTSSAHKRANIVEVMGRHCGDLALYAGIAGGAEFRFRRREEKNARRQASRQAPPHYSSYGRQAFRLRLSERSGRGHGHRDAGHCAGLCAAGRHSHRRRPHQCLPLRGRGNHLLPRR